jgi:hypothetical protein
MSIGRRKISRKIRQIPQLKTLKSNLNGRIYHEDGTSSPFVLEDNVEERLEHSLKGTELDTSLLRVGCRENSKIPDRKGWNKEDFRETIEELLQNNNYSIRTGRFVDNTHILVLDYDNKGEYLRISFTVNGTSLDLKPLMNS